MLAVFDVLIDVWTVRELADYVSEDCWVSESVVVGRVDGGNDASSTSYSGGRSGFFLPCVGITGL